MSLTNHQLLQFERHIDEYGRVLPALRQALDECHPGLVDFQGNPTAMGRDALATVPHLVDPEPPPPKTPDTRECSACDGQGVRRVAHEFEVRDPEAGKLTRHTRSTLVVCDAPGCERGRVTIRARYVGTCYGEPREDVRDRILKKIFEATDQHRAAADSWETPQGIVAAGRRATQYQIAYDPFGVGASHGETARDRTWETPQGVAAAIRRGLDYNGAPLQCAPGEITYSIPIAATIELHKRQAGERTPPKTKPALVHVTKEDTQREAGDPRYSAETMEHARRSTKFHAYEGAGGIVVAFGRHRYTPLHIVPVDYLVWAVSTLTGVHSVAVFEAELARRQGAGQ